MTVRDYSTTANDNTTIGGISLADTMLANALDNAIRQQMADSANFLLDISKPTSTTGSSDTYVLSTGGTVSAYGDKVRLAIRASFSNIGACTINVDTLGVKDLKVYTSTGIDDPSAGQIQSGGVYDIMYVDALGDFVVLNPASSSGLVIGTDVQAWDAQLDTIAGGSAANATAVTNLTGTNSGDETAATTSAEGVSELATDAEGLVGTDTSRVPPVSTAKAMIADLTGITDGTNGQVLKTDGSRGFTFDDAGGWTDIDQVEPTSDVTEMAVTGLSGYSVIEVRVAGQASGTAAITIEGRVSAGTWRSLEIDSAGASGDGIFIVLTINNFNNTFAYKPKVLSGVYGDGGGAGFDRTNSSGIDIGSASISGYWARDEVWDEIRLTGNFEGSAADDRTYMYVRGIV